MDQKSLDIEDEVRNYLVAHDIYPFSVIYIHNPGMLKLSFFLPSDLTEFLDLTKLSKVCDNSGLNVFTDTVLLTGAVLNTLFKHVTEYQENN